MKIEHSNGVFTVYRESNERRSYFSFWVDADKSSWTQWWSQARYFNSEESAQVAIVEIKRRNKVRRGSTQR